VSPYQVIWSSALEVNSFVSNSYVQNTYHSIRHNERKSIYCIFKPFYTVCDIRDILNKSPTMLFKCMTVYIKLSIQIYCFAKYRLLLQIQYSYVILMMLCSVNYYLLWKWWRLKCVGFFLKTDCIHASLGYIAEHCKKSTLWTWKYKLN
jgi:hypothetical protein